MSQLDKIKQRARKWIKETEESFKEATDGKDISLFLHCKECMQKYKDKEVRPYGSGFAEVGFVGRSRSLLRVACGCCHQTIFEENLFAIGKATLEEFLEL